LKKNSFAVQAGVYVIGNALQRALAYLALPIYAHVMAPDEYGRYAVFVSAMSIINLLVDFGLSKAAARHYVDHERHQGRLRHFLEQLQVQRLLTTLVIGAVIALVTIPIWKPLTAGAMTWWPFVPLLLLIGATDSFLLIVVLIHRMRQQPMSFVALKLGQALGQLIFGLVAVTLFHTGAGGAATGTALGSTVIAIGAFVLYRLRLVPKDAAASDVSAIQLWRENVSYGAPLVFYDLAFWLRTQADPFILVRFIGLTAVGVYQLGYVAGMVMGLVVVSIDLAYAPMYYRWKRAVPQADEMHKAATATLALGLGAVAIWGVLLARPTLLAVFGPHRALAAEVAPCLILAHYVYSHYLSNSRPLFFTKQVLPLTIFSTGVSASCVAATCFLVPRFGAMAAAWMNVVTFSLLTTGGTLISRRVAPQSTSAVGVQIGVTAVVALIVLLDHEVGSSGGIAAIVGRILLAAALSAIALGLALKPLRRLKLWTSESAKQPQPAAA
jgi:O-antigen/teichoic acid export membrane protein